MKKLKNPDKKKINYNLGEQIHDNVTLTNINWFPGHMSKAIKQVKQRLKMVDIVLEVRDARSPLVTGNKALAQAFGEKNHLIVINKKNLADPESLKLWDVWFQKQGIPFIFTNCLDTGALKLIVQKAKDVVRQRRLQSNPDGKFKTTLKMMVIGLPNTGKSTIINKMANRNASKVANRPGQTQHQLWVKVDQDLSILDTPGIMPPKIDKHEHGLWLASLHAIPDNVITPEVPACYIVEHLLKEKSEIFKERYNLESLDIDLIETLDQIAKVKGCLRHKGEPDYDRVYKLVLTDFRSGNLGRISFGVPPAIR